MTPPKLPVVACPHCAIEVLWDKTLSPFRPFCSERCKLIDLGQWASENYRIPQADLAQDDAASVQ